jgi:hypothetical protein
VLADRPFLRASLALAQLALVALGLYLLARFGGL